MGWDASKGVKPQHNGSNEQPISNDGALTRLDSAELHHNTRRVYTTLGQHLQIEVIEQNGALLLATLRPPGPMSVTSKPLASVRQHFSLLVQFSIETDFWCLQKKKNNSTYKVSLANYIVTVS